MKTLRQLRGRYRKAIWDVDPAALSGMRAAAVKIMRTLGGVCNQISQGQLTLRAMTLVYTTLLSLVLLIAISFSILMSVGCWGRWAWSCSSGR